MTTNPYIFNDAYPDKDIQDYNPEEAYELGVDTGVHFDDGQRSSLIRLIVKEKQDNNDSNDGSYNPYWDNILEKLGESDELAPINDPYGILDEHDKFVKNLKGGDE